MTVKALFLALALAASAAFAEDAAPPVPPPIALPRIPAGAITLDGDLSDPGWQQAARIDSFFETVFADNRAPVVQTLAFVAYDDHFLYIAVRCDDPAPQKIRAPYADRDNVIGTDDNVAIFLDTRNDHRSAQEFRVNPRGIQGDAIFNDANGNEDFSPDFYYATAAKITEAGWQVELRIPLTSLRYPKADPQTWGIIVWRNYPRDRRYAIYSSPQPRGANCVICRTRELTGITGLPSSGHLVAAPYASAQDVARAPETGAPLQDQPTDTNFGLDVKWSPTASTALDATINPDFSQVEADVAQIAVNNRFALFFPEKRPFFLEGIDLFDTPIQAVYTRTITSPRWGSRVTGKLGASAFTLLLAQDRGGGSVVLPGPSSSDFAPQDFRSIVGVGRVRRDFGGSFVGAVYTGRAIEGGGHNQVLGPDFQWRPSDRDAVTGQFLLSDTRTPVRPELASDWDGRKLTSHGASLEWAHNAQSYDWDARYRDFGDGFRADDGFVPQVGYRSGRAIGGYRFFPKGLLSFVRPYGFAELQWDTHGDLITQHAFPGVFVLGRHNLQAELDVNLDKVRVGSALLSKTQLAYFGSVDPSRRLSRITVNGFLGEEIDFAGGRVGRGGQLTVTASLRPSDHVTLEAINDLQWLNVKGASLVDGRLFTAQVQRLKATYNASARLFVRLIGQYVTTKRDPSLYPFAVARKDGDFSGSLLFSYRLNWQTALFLGYGDDRALDAKSSLVRTGRQLFFKLSYAYQR